MSAEVFFIDFRTTVHDSIMVKLKCLLESAGLPDVLRPRDLAGIKLHFGELGNAAFNRPIYVRCIVDAVRQADAVAFLTDANTLYAGSRSSAPRHLTTAIQNGFAYAVVEAPLVIADGLRGKSESVIPIHGKRFQRAYELVNV